MRHGPNRRRSLATHIEVALVCSPPSAIVGLTDTDRYRRAQATRSLALYLAERLGCFELIAGPDLSDAYPGLFEELSRARQ